MAFEFVRFLLGILNRAMDVQWKRAIKIQCAERFACGIRMQNETGSMNLSQRVDIINLLVVM